jgi:hypothetical protein
VAAAGRPRRRFGRGLAEGLCVPALFAVLGLAWAQALAATAGDGPSGYPPTLVDPRPETPHIWLVDGFNVVHWGLLGGRERSDWWSAPVRGELLTRAAAFDDPAAEVWVVFDGPRARPEGPAHARLHEVFARSADEWLLGRIRASSDPARIALVTADRRLADRARGRGAAVVSPSEFLDRCPESTSIDRPMG